ncbi:hypothetical protein GGR51DRAFT_150541 [Nemania sp. FL0031]|nr:hypothetical protein GGR51DRAFT_150541 [Nemania sp. FL0031]
MERSIDKEGMRKPRRLDFERYLQSKYGKPDGEHLERRIEKTPEAERKGDQRLDWSVYPAGSTMLPGTNKVPYRNEAPIPPPLAPIETVAEPSEDINTRREFLDFLCPRSPNPVHQNLVRTRVKDSGTWLFNHSVFKNWIRMEFVDTINSMSRYLDKCLWLSGELGTGKTILMSAVIDYLLAEKRGTTAVVFYYFDRSLPSSPRDAIASLLRQLYSQTDTGPPPWFLAKPLGNGLAPMKKTTPSSDGDNSDTSTGFDEKPLAPIPVGDMISDFLSLQLRFKRVYICLDGLDECDDLPALFEFLARLVTSLTPFRLAISARPQIVRSGISTHIGDEDMVVILEQHNAPDIHYYVQAHAMEHDHFSDIIGLEALPDYIKQWTKKSGGNFLAATAEMVELKRLTTKHEIDQYMNRPSIGLPEIFGQIWSRFDDQSPLRAILAKRIFYWLSISRRALTFKELQQAIAIEPETSSASQALDLGERLSPPGLIEEVCMGFVRVNTSENGILTYPSALPFYFYQFNASFAEEAKEYVAKCFIRFLNSDILSNGAFKSQEEYDQMDRSFPFLRYVSQHWGTHLNDLEDGDIQESVEKLLGNVPLMGTMSQLLHVNRPTAVERRRYDDYPSEFGGKHFGAYFHLQAAFRKWTSRQDWKVPKDSWGRNPFHVASISPSLHTRHVLFYNCPDNTFSHVISARYYPEDDASHTPNVSKEPPAVDKPDKNIEEYSKGLCSGLVPKLPWTWPWTTKQFNTHVPFVLEDITALDNQGKTPLHHFIVEWSESRFNHMLGQLSNLQQPSDKGADKMEELLPTLADCNGRTLLDYACLRNAMFVGLVYCNATWPLKAISNAINVAAAGGHLWAIRYLLELFEPDFGIPTSNLDLTIAVIEASKRGFTDIVKLLRDEGGVNIGSSEKDTNGMTALHYAAYGSHVETVRYLLDEGADAHCIDKLGNTPLFYASERGDREIVSLLLNKGARPDAINKEGFSPLQLAARYVKLTDRVYGFFTEPSYCYSEQRKSLFHFAAEYGQDQVARFFLDKGFPCDSDDTVGRTPLSYACQAGHLPIVELLLSRKLDVNSRDTVERTPLSYAAAGGYAEVVDILLRQPKIDPNLMDIKGRSPLMYATQNGHEAVARLLGLKRRGSGESSHEA